MAFVEDEELDFADFITNGLLHEDIIQHLNTLTPTQATTFINGMPDKLLLELIELDFMNQKKSAVILKNYSELMLLNIEEKIFKLQEWKPLGPNKLVTYTNPNNGETIDYQLAIGTEKGRLLFVNNGFDTFPQYAVLQSEDQQQVDSYSFTSSTSNNINCGDKRSFKQFQQNDDNAEFSTRLISETPDLDFGAQSATFSNILQKTALVSGNSSNNNNSNNNNSNNISNNNSNNNYSKDNSDEFDDEEYNDNNDNNDNEELNDNEEFNANNDGGSDMKDTECVQNATKPSALRFNTRVIYFSRNGNVMSEGFRWHL
eukprot:516533_1